MQNNNNILQKCMKHIIHCKVKIKLLQKYALKITSINWLYSEFLCGVTLVKKVILCFFWKMYTERFKYSDKITIIVLKNINIILKYLTKSIWGTLYYLSAKEIDRKILFGVIRFSPAVFFYCFRESEREVVLETWFLIISNFLHTINKLRFFWKKKG